MHFIIDNDLLKKSKALKYNKVILLQADCPVHSGQFHAFANERATQDLPPPVQRQSGEHLPPGGGAILSRQDSV